ncbi:MAG: hypothetical protein M3Q56_09640 [Bacteroidota bacterium]|nr:hypothetical protein [Bacteroidota bacterium]
MKKLNVFLLSNYFFKRSLLFGITFLQVINYFPVISQTQIPYKNLEIKKEKKWETYINGVRRLRKSDNAVQQAISMNLSLPGQSLNEKATYYLTNNWSKFKHTACFDITLKEEEEDIFDRVVKYRQYYKGLPVDYNQVILSFNKAQKLTAISQNTVPILNDIDINPKISQQEAIKSLLSYFNCKIFPEVPKIDLIIHVNQDSISLAYKCNVSTKLPAGSWLVYLDAISGKILEVYNNSLSYVDGTGKIFEVDPITSSHGTYGQGSLEDDDDNNNATFDALYKQVDLIGITQDGSDYILKGAHTEIADYDNNGELFIQNSSAFNFDRSQ